MPSKERLQIEVGPPRREEFAVSARLSREIAEIIHQHHGVPQWLTPRQVAQRYPISETMLARMRYMRRGPRFRRVSYKVLLYSSFDIETYLQSLPAGGDSRLRTATAAKDGSAKKRSKIPA